MRKFFLALAIMFPGFLLATVMVPLNINQLTEQAEKIVIGHCTDKRVYERGNMIWTEYTIKVYEVLKGGEIKEIKIRQPGGEIGDRGVKVAGAVSFGKLEESVLFLDKEKDGAYDLIGWAQGKFHVYWDDKTRTKYILQNLDGISFVQKDGKPVAVEPIKMELEQFKALIKAINAQKKGK